MFAAIAIDRKRADRGFALLDLMVSVLILGLLLVPLALARNNVILLAERTVLLRKARSLAAMKMGELALVKPAEIAPSSGDFGQDNPGFTWETGVEVVSLRELVGAPPVAEDAAETVAAAEDVELADSFEKYEVVKLVLAVKFTAPEGDEDAEDAKKDLGIESGEERKFRALDRVVIVRYVIREVEEEDLE